MIETKRRARRRRTAMLLLVIAASAALAACLRSPSIGARAAPAWRQGMAVQLYSFHRDLERDLPGTLRAIKALGFDRVETYPLNGITPSQLRAALDEAGLRAVSAHMPWERIRTDLAGVIRDARTLGVEQFGPGSINLFDGGPFRTLGTADAEEAGAHLKRACAAARAADMRIFIHTHGNEFAPNGDTAPLDRMLRAAGSCFLIEADLAWVKWAGADPAKFVRRYGKHVRSLHLKDIAAAAVGREMGQVGAASFTILGQGSIDWPAVMRAARAAGVRHYIIEDESADPFGQIPRSMRYLDAMPASN
jgi:sugar phosphate isomerase/epimerase